MASYFEYQTLNEEHLKKDLLNFRCLLAAAQVLLNRYAGSLLRLV